MKQIPYLDEVDENINNDIISRKEFQLFKVEENINSGAEIEPTFNLETAKTEIESANKEFKNFFTARKALSFLIPLGGINYTYTSHLLLYISRIFFLYIHFWFVYCSMAVVENFLLFRCNFKHMRYARWNNNSVTFLNNYFF